MWDDAVLRRCFYGCHVATRFRNCLDWAQPFPAYRHEEQKKQKILLEQQKQKHRENCLTEAGGSESLQLEHHFQRIKAHGNESLDSNSRLICCVIFRSGPRKLKTLEGGGKTEVEKTAEERRRATIEARAERDCHQTPIFSCQCGAGAVEIGWFRECFAMRFQVGKVLFYLFQGFQ